jgi:hypothetical protein
MIWDDQGDVIQSGAGEINHVISPLHTEIWASLKGVKAAIELGIGRLLLETEHNPGWCHPGVEIFDNWCS